jgi:hypothetical protein
MAGVNPSPFLVVPAMLWTVAAALAVVAALLFSLRTGRREPESASAAWNPFGPGFPAIGLAAVAGYAVAAAVRGELALADGAFAVLWPTTASTALAYAGERGERTLPRWTGPAFAAAGAVLYGALPI